MKFIIRDDDLNYFTKPADIEKWYAGIFSRGISVAFAAIPFIKPSSDVLCGAPSEPDIEYPISGNRELVDYVKNNKNIEILQHGCIHVTEDGVFEYRKHERLFEDTKRGKEELESAFERKISIFVPPHDALSNYGIKAIESQNLNVIRGLGSANFIFRFEYAVAIVKMILHRLAFPNKSEMPAYPFTLDYGKHKESYAVRLGEERLDYLLRSLRYANSKRGNFIVTNHFIVTTSKEMENLNALIDEARRLGFEFGRADDLFHE
ncbi:MAG: hypothetical protein JWM20_824 [Patescibacteria group bacterium]|nr:hypothetical protein [Patescibacteria group bacterium]